MDSWTEQQRTKPPLSVSGKTRSGLRSGGLNHSLAPKLTALGVGE
jgi:hypothetical protein